MSRPLSGQLPSPPSCSWCGTVNPPDYLGRYLGRPICSWCASNDPRVIGAQPAEEEPR